MRSSGDPAPPVRAGPDTRSAHSPPGGPTDVEQDAYGPTAIAHFTEPRNVGAVEAPDGRGSDANPSCGDRTAITVRLAEGRIAEARFRTFGCVAAIASASLLTDMVRGRTVREARELEPGDVIAALGGLPGRKHGCALMAVGALRAALVDAEVRAGARP